MGQSFLSRRSFFGGAAVFISTSWAMASEPNIAIFTLHVVPEGWVLDIDAALITCRTALEKKHGDLSGVSAMEVRRYLSDYIRANVRLYFDGLPVHLTTISFPKDDDESQMRCPLRAPKPEPTKIRAELLAFNEEGRQRNLLRVEIPGGEGQVLASNATGYVAEWVQGQEQFETPDLDDEPSLEHDDALAELPPPPAAPAPQKKKDEGPTLGIVAAAALGALGIAMVFRKRALAPTAHEDPPQPGG